MPDTPDGLDRARHAALDGRGHEPWVRRAVLTLVLAIAVAGLANAFGQRAHTSTAAGPAARLDVRAPSTVRGGLLFQATVRVTALRAIAHPRLVLDQGWLEGLQVNTIEPGPVGESSRDGRLVLSYDGLSKGDQLLVYLQFQLDPTNTGRTVNGIELDDAETPLVSVSRTLRRLP